MNTNGNYPRFHYCYEYSSDGDADFTMANPPVGKAASCPRYANNACFVSEFADPSGTYSEGLYKGCSPFDFGTQQPQCNEWDNEKSNCKQQCLSSYCNREGVRALQQCYVCTESFDHAGNKVDNGPGNCVNLVGDEYLEDCSPIYDSCETDTVTDWNPDGSQEYKIIRKCHDLTPTESDGDTRCVQGTSSYVQYKDCYNICTGNGCNNNSDVDRAHSRLDENGEPIQISCYEFSSNFDNATGADFDPENPLFDLADNLDAKSRNCPNFANWGCFTANFTEGSNGISGLFEDSFNKGCSMFEPSDKPTDCQNLASYGRACKRQTSTSMGNIGGMELWQCQQCEVEFDHLGNIISGDETCFTNPDDHLDDCDVGSPKMCVNNFSADFTFEGKLVYKMKRSCAVDETIIENNETCDETFETAVENGNPDMYNIHKACTTVCDERNCNNNNHIEQLFVYIAPGADYARYQYCYRYDSSLDPDFDAENPGIGSGGQCPLYANAGCFVSNFTIDGEVGFYRGCTPFSYEMLNPACAEWDNGSSTCKQQCTEHYCNRDKIRSPTRCHVCAADFNHRGEKIGDGDDNCVNIGESDEYLTDCDLRYDHCETDTITDWLANGEQTYKLRRKCSQAVPDDHQMTQCFQGSSTFLEYKDCYQHCYGDGCNGNNDVNQEHSRLDEEGNPVSLECYAYSRSSTGDWDAEVMQCPNYANWGCFTGNFTNVDWEHGNEDFIDQLNKGCSMFEPSVMPTRCNDFIASSFACKQQCEDSLCNTGELVEPEFQCQQCEVKFDHLGNILSGDSNCFSSTTRNLVDCPTGTTQCVNYMQAHFTIHGGLEYDFIRTCSNDEMHPNIQGSWECEMNTNGFVESGVEFGFVEDYEFEKRCFTVCDEPRCNENNDIEDYFDMNGDNEDFRYCYGYSSDFDETFEGITEPEFTLGTPVACPKYANAGCFVSNYTNLDGSYENPNGFYRGCSPFDFGDIDPRCNAWVYNETEAIWGRSCKQQCTGAYCNSQAIKEPTRCYVCAEVFDHTGGLTGFDPLDSNCYQLNGTEHLKTCNLNFDHCETQVYTDWWMSGLQLYRVERKCASGQFDVDNPTQCEQGSTGTNYYKDCFNQCLEDECNNNIDVESEFTRLDEFGNPVELECYVFGSPSDLPPNPGSDLNIYDDLLNAKTMKCPNYANWGCFSGNFSDNGNDFGSSLFENAINKGCSMFDLGGNREIECSPFINGSGSCKKQCDTDLCNAYGMDTRTQCQVCKESLDHTGRQKPGVMSDSGCYDMSEDYTQTCGYQERCYSKLIVDWYLDGEQLLTFERGCTAEPANEPSPDCRTGASSTINYKDCWLTCDGDNCNNNNDVELAYAARDENGNIKEIACYEYSTPNDFEGDTTDLDLNLADNLDVHVRQCPRFANNGCFKGNVTVLDPESVFSNLFSNSIAKGCSMFDLDERATLCNNALDDSVAACKQHCTTDLCNFGGMDMTASTHSCQVCTETQNHIGQQLGGDRGCYDGSRDYNRPCPAGQNTCATSLRVDWLDEGSQVLEFERYCTSEEIPEGSCVDGGNDISFFKDCEITCSDENCNTDNDVELLYSKLDENGNPVEISCYEYDTSQLPPGTEDFNSATNIDYYTRECPRFANNGCFRGNATNNPENEYLSGDTIAKGCSMFDATIDGVACRTVAGNTMCKTLCEDSYCNQD